MSGVIETAADAEHAGDESDREPHGQDQEDIDRQVGDREVDLHALRSRGWRPKIKSRGERHLRRRHAGEADRVSTGFAARHPTWRPTKSRQQAAKPTCANSWHRRRRRDAPRMGRRLGTQRVGEGILPVLARAGTSRRAIYCAGRGIDKSNLAPAAGGLRLGAGAGTAAAVSQPPAGVLTCVAASGCGSGVKSAARPARPSAIVHRDGRPRRRAFWRLHCRPRGRRGEPPVGLGQVLLHPDAAGAENSEVVLAVGDAVIGRLAEPLAALR